MRLDPAAGRRQIDGHRKTRLRPECPEQLPEELLVAVGSLDEELRLPLAQGAALEKADRFRPLGRLHGQSFAFNGYLPVKPPERVQAIRRFERRAQSERQSQLFIEAPYRNVKLMEQLLQTLAPETRLTLAMDITAPGEYIRTLAVREWRSVRLPEMNRHPAIFIIG